MENSYNEINLMFPVQRPEGWEVWKGMKIKHKSFTDVIKNLNFSRLSQVLLFDMSLPSHLLSAFDVM